MTSIRYGQRNPLKVLATAVIALGTQCAHAGPGDIASCTNLAKLALANTTINSAVYVAPASTVPGYCEVNATVGPQTDIVVRMPDLWYQRYLQLGGGGFDGSVPNPPHRR